MDSVRQNIASNLLTRLQSISVANGYTTDYNLITDWRLYPLEKDDLPAIIMQDDTNTIEAFNDVFTDNILEVTIGIFIKGDEPSKQLRNYIQDVYKCVGADEYCGGYASKIEPVSDIINLQQKDDVFGDVELKFKIFYTCGSWNLIKNLS
jgi:hypothetical protein